MQMIITYTLNFMDKNALSYSANFGLIDDNVSKSFLQRPEPSLMNTRDFTENNIAGRLAPSSTLPTWCRSQWSRACSCASPLVASSQSLPFFGALS